MAAEREDKTAWKLARTLHAHGWIELVTRRLPYVPEWLDDLFKRVMGHQKRQLTDGDYGYRCSFAEMQRMYMRRLQAQLIDIAISVQFENDELKNSGQAGRIGDALRQYVQAVQDHEYMAKFSRRSDDPFIASSERQHDHILILNAMNLTGKTARDLNERKARAIPTGPWENSTSGAQPVGGTRTEALSRALWSRIGAALLGGIFLVGPMWALSLRREAIFQLGFTTGCVFSFALLVAWYASTADVVFTATLAYAAVLMVFVGAVD